MQNEELRREGGKGGGELKAEPECNGTADGPQANGLGKPEPERSEDGPSSLNPRVGGCALGVAGAAEPFE